MLLITRNMFDNCSDSILLYHGMRIAKDLHKKFIVISCDSKIEVFPEYIDLVPNPINIINISCKLTNKHITLKYKSYYYKMYYSSKITTKISSILHDIIRFELVPSFMNQYGDNFILDKITEIII